MTKHPDPAAEDDGDDLNVIEIPMSAWAVLPSPPGTCPECGTEHDPRLPHNQQSLPYLVRFKIAHGRDATWHDAMAHCTPEVKETWAAALADEGVYINLKAYHINDCDTYAGRDLDEAIRAAMDDSGLTREEVYEPLVACEADPATRVKLDVDDAQSGYTTIGEILRTMTRPGMVCSTEY
jgi:hypothetical protein